MLAAENWETSVAASVILTDWVKIADALSGEASERVWLFQDASASFKSEAFRFPPRVLKGGRKDNSVHKLQDWD